MWRVVTLEMGGIDASTTRAKAKLSYDRKMKFFLFFWLEPVGACLSGHPKPASTMIGTRDRPTRMDAMSDDQAHLDILRCPRSPIEICGMLPYDVR